jgi:spore coat protein A, manganese oxidase
MTFQQVVPKTMVITLLALLAVTGCGSGSNTIVGSTSPALNPINPKTLVQFQNPFIEIPIAPVTASTYTVTVRKSYDWDFGLRVVNGVTGNVERPTNPETGKTIVTPTWYYDVNGAALGIYGATVEVASGTPATITYVNDLRDETLDAHGKPQKGTGKRLTKHLLAVDPTLDGMNLGEPEVRIVTHLHGGHVDWRYDGHPEAWITNIPSNMQTKVKYGLAADPSRGFPGRPSDNKVKYVYANDQDASTLWFHDHSYGITRLAAYAGMAAVYIIRDPFEAGLGLPSGLGPNPVVPTLQSYKYDLPVVLQDKSFTADGAMIFPTFINLSTYTWTILHDKQGNPTNTVRPEMFGTVNVVNGQAWPSKTVERTGYRFRFVNGADSRVYNLWLQDADTGEIITPALATAASSTLVWPIMQVAAEQGLFPEAVPAMTGSRDLGLTLANGERADIVIDFSHPVFMKNGKGRKLILRNDAPAPYGGLFGPANEDMTTLDPTTTGKVMRFVVDETTAAVSYDTKLKAWESALRPFGPGEDLSLVVPDKTRYLDFQERKDLSYAFYDPIAATTTYRTQLLINGLRFADPITEVITKDDVEEWVVINTTPDMHPLHLHLVKFQVIEKGHILAGAEGSNAGVLPVPPNYIRADGAGALPEPILNYTSYVPNTDPRSDPSGTPTGTLVPDTPGNSLYARSGNETGWKDTVMVPPAEIEYDPNGASEVVNPGYIKIRAKFDLPAGAQSPATYMYHCHILSHEEHEMMRPFTVEP